ATDRTCLGASSGRPPDESGGDEFRGLSQTERYVCQPRGIRVLVGIRFRRQRARTCPCGGRLRRFLSDPGCRAVSWTRFCGGGASSARRSGRGGQLRVLAEIAGGRGGSFQIPLDNGGGRL